MDVSKYKFKVHLKPQENELLSSWLARMAHAHFIKTSSFLNLYIKNNRFAYSKIDLDFYSNDSFFELLNEKSNLSKEELLKMSLRSQEGHLFTNIGQYPPKQIRKLIDKRSTNGLMYCPKCLKEDNVPYFKKKWRYSFYTVCTKHEIFLTDRCWRCYKPIKLVKTKINKDLSICHNCEKDLKYCIVQKINANYKYGLKAIKWLENGLNNGFFVINGHQIWSVMFFEIIHRLRHLFSIRKDNLNLSKFPLMSEYKDICKKQDIYASKKAMQIKKNLIEHSFIYYLFQDYPKNLIEFIKQNKLIYNDFSHGLKYLPFWYKNMLDEIIPKENKQGRIINESEVLGAIKYLKSKGEIVNQKNVAEIIGCHFTIHKGFVKLYKKVNLR